MCRRSLDLCSPHAVVVGGTVMRLILSAWFRLGLRTIFNVLEVDGEYAYTCFLRFIFISNRHHRPFVYFSLSSTLPYPLRSLPLLSYPLICIRCSSRPATPPPTHFLSCFSFLPSSPELCLFVSFSSLCFLSRHLLSCTIFSRRSFSAILYLLFLVNVLHTRIHLCSYSEYRFI